MADLLLITDIPRLRELFQRLAETDGLPLRVAGSLETGVEELVADKPAMVFVQTHLSGLSADILLMHLKKQLGRRRTRFVLLSPADQASEAQTRLYHFYIDTQLEDGPLQDAIRKVAASLAQKSRKTGTPLEAGTSPVTLPDTMAPSTRDESVSQSPGPHDNPRPPASLDVPESSGPEKSHTAMDDAPEEEKTAHVTVRTPLSVYSEFTGELDSAVQRTAPLPFPLLDVPSETALGHEAGKDKPRIAARPKSRYLRPLALLGVVLAAVVGVTYYQYQGEQPPASGPVSIAAPVIPATPATGTPPRKAEAPKPIPAITASVPAATHPVAPPVPAPATPRAAPAAPRPTSIPDFIPRAGLDKTYGAEHPGWERYRGAVTDFKVFREGASIKAIQVLDRGGRGIPDTFMKGVFAQLAPKASLKVTAAEKKEGYEIQRGNLNENLSTVLYRDGQEPGRLRAFVVTWR